MSLPKARASLPILIHNATEVIRDLGLKLDDVALRAMWLAVRDLGCTQVTLSRPCGDLGRADTADGCLSGDNKLIGEAVPLPACPSFSFMGQV